VHARHAILRVLLEEGQGVVSIKRVTDSNGQADLEIHLDRSKIKTVGREAIGKFLQKIQVYKATANHAEAQKMYSHYTSVGDDYMELREIVLAKKKPRPIYVQPLTQPGPDGNITYVRYGPSHEEVIRSFVDRYLPLADLVLDYWKQAQR